MIESADELANSVEAIGIFGVGSGLLAWLIKSLVKQALDRDIEVFKHELRKAHEIQMEEAKNRFTFGATSHMANVAFDKHIEFSEEYANAVLDALIELATKGPKSGASGHAQTLADVRTKWLIWVTPEVNKRLIDFEYALRSIGAYMEEAHESQPGLDKHEAYTKGYAIFAEIMGLEKWNGQPISQERAGDAIIIKLREVLGITELTELRRELVKRASDDLVARR